MNDYSKILCAGELSIDQGYFHEKNPASPPLLLLNFLLFLSHRRFSFHKIEIGVICSAIAHLYFFVSDNQFIRTDWPLKW